MNGTDVDRDSEDIVREHARPIIIVELVGVSLTNVLNDHLHAFPRCFLTSWKLVDYQFAVLCVKPLPLIDALPIGRFELDPPIRLEPLESFSQSVLDKSCSTDGTTDTWSDDIPIGRVCMDGASRCRCRIDGLVWEEEIL